MSISVGVRRVRTEMAMLSETSHRFRGSVSVNWVEAVPPFVLPRSLNVGIRIGRDGFSANYQRSSYLLSLALAFVSTPSVQTPTRQSNCLTTLWTTRIESGLCSWSEALRFFITGEFRGYWQVTGDLLPVIRVENITDKIYRQYLDLRIGQVFFDLV